ncbi:N-acetylmuramoyl-L-alanine amidase [Paramixta manurensis]|uniref:N-acetylmuramoyl-L-alanine amidase n=1 Tax=Paramixta manurensis TaxID=2740817 RepID=A0A6M8U7A2_9GAMM|nr:N-acetylmuramoyl-L-alanine amidase [Erwiniaceae bacterium PD-1]
MRLIIVLLALWLTACSTSGLEQRPGYVVDTRHPAQGAQPRIKMVVIHYTAEDFPQSLTTLTGNQVSAHYLIPAKPPQHAGQPVVWQLVPEAALAWHAGPSFWRGASRINDTSVGIELVNAGYRRNAQGQRIFAPFSASQIAALQPLLRDIVHRYGIAPQNIVGHSDVAPQRKQDPGPLFPWALLAQQGIGAWPDAARVRFWLDGRDPQASVPVEEVLNALADYGYAVNQQMTPEQQQKVIAAFQMHFRPSDYRGLPDAETLAIAKALVGQYGSGD